MVERLGPWHGGMTRTMAWWNGQLPDKSPTTLSLFPLSATVIYSYFFSTSPLLTHTHTHTHTLSLALWCPCICIIFKQASSKRFDVPVLGAVLHIHVKQVRQTLSLCIDRLDTQTHIHNLITETLNEFHLHNTILPHLSHGPKHPLRLLKVAHIFEVIS